MIPIFIRDYLPHRVIGILIVAIFSAAMSSLSSAINSLSAAAVKDFFNRNKSLPAEKTTNHLGRTLSVTYFTSVDAAFIELASASSLVLLENNERNSLLKSAFGKNGAAYVYAPQKGATLEQVKYLDHGLRHFSQIVQQHYGMDLSHLLGGEAAGGIGASLVSLFGATLQSGFVALPNSQNLNNKLPSPIGSSAMRAN